MTKTKTLILMRHGHRDRISGESDNGLSSKGYAQAQDSCNAIKLFLSNTSKEHIELHSSPKLRCQETIEPLAIALNASVIVNPLLHEMTYTESHNDMLERIREFLSDWKKSDIANLIACSHSDWIPIATDLLVGKHLSVNTGCFYVLECREPDGLVQVIRYHQPSI